MITTQSHTWASQELRRLYSYFTAAEISALETSVNVSLAPAVHMVVFSTVFV